MTGVHDAPSGGHDVAIVGAGAVGLLLACLLAQRGIREAAPVTRLALPAHRDRVGPALGMPVVAFDPSVATLPAELEGVRLLPSVDAVVELADVSHFPPRENPDAVAQHRI